MSSGMIRGHYVCADQEMGTHAPTTLATIMTLTLVSRRRYDYQQDE